MVGHGRKPVSDYDSSSHQSEPLSSLKDPASFGPPPRRTGTSETLGSAGIGSQHAPSPSTSSYRISTPTSASASGGGLGAPLGKQYGESLAAKRERERREAEEAEASPLPPRAYSSNTTGLDTAGFAPPPKVRGDGFADHVAKTNQSAAAVRPKPGLPPRLPPRGTAGNGTPPPPSYEQVEAENQTAVPDQGMLNRGAVNRLGQAGVSVPGLGVGDGNARATPPVPDRSQASPKGHSGQMSELQARFARMGSASSNGAEESQQASTSTGKKPKPPPPPKKNNLQSTSVSEEPPPIPLASKPR